MTLDMQEGTGGLMNTPCGTDGLTFCVGLGYQTNGQWFVAHFDTDIQVPIKQPGNLCYNEVVAYVTNTIGPTLPAPMAGTMVYTVTASRDPSALAIIQGIKAHLAGFTFDAREGNSLLVDQNNQVTSPMNYPSPQLVVGNVACSVTRALVNPQNC